MSYTRRRTEVAENQADAPDERQCKALGCRLPGSRGEAGAWVCSWHGMADAQFWPAVTSAMHDNSWLTDLICDLQRLYSQGKDDDARKLARDFWADYPDQQPTEYEAKFFPQYLLRMRDEFAFRVIPGRKPTPPYRPQSDSFKAEKFSGSGLPADFAIKAGAQMPDF